MNKENKMSRNAIMVDHTAISGIDAEEEEIGKKGEANLDFL